MDGKESAFSLQKKKKQEHTCALALHKKCQRNAKPWRQSERCYHPSQRAALRQSCPFGGEPFPCGLMPVINRSY